MTSRAALLATLALTLACNSTSSSTKVAPAVRSAEAVPPAPLEPNIPLPKIPAADARERAIAIGIRELLQSEHVGARKIDDSISKKACERFIERLDPGKLFLLQAHVDELSRHAERLDDELAAGELTLARLGGALIAQ